MKLALKRGISHSEFLRTTSAREIQEYQALHLIDPLFDGERFEASIGQLTNLTYNINRGDSKATTLGDWLPDYVEQLKLRQNPPEVDEDGFRVQSDEEQMELFDKWLGS